MSTLTMPPSPLQRAMEINEVLRVWAEALGCPANQVTDVVCRAGIPIEKLWNSIDAASRRRGAH